MDYTRDFETAVQTFVLGKVPAGTPADASFSLLTSLEDWKTGVPELKFRLEHGRWTLHRAYPLGTLLAYKVTRDARGSEEGDAWGQRRPDRHVLVQGEAEHVLDIVSWQDQGQGPRPSTLTGSTETFTVHSPELDHDFTVTVWLPPQAETTDQRFPVLYLNDGGNVFDGATAFAGVEWGADETAQALAETGLPCLMVAVHVRGAYRAHDYVPFEILRNNFQSSAAQYQGFLADTLRPLIGARFPTLPDATHTAQAGSSFGGVASLYGGLSSPEVWGTVGAFSPSLDVQGGALFDWSAGYPAPGTRLYLDMGTLEGDSLQEAALHVHRTRLYAAQMRPRLREVKLELGDGHRHDEAAWAARFPAFLNWWLTGLPH
jgi:predicted alpha/beta superfamily hydrolase